MIIINNPDTTIVIPYKTYYNNNTNLLIIKTKNIELYSKKYNMNYIYCISYSQFIKNITEQKTYGFFVTNISFRKGIDNINIVLLGNHGYNKTLDLLFTFDSLFFNRFEFEEHFKAAIPIIFLSDIISTALVLYSLKDNRPLEFNNFVVLFEHHTYNKNLIHLIYRQAPVKSNIKTYFNNYKNLIKFFQNKKEANFYFIKPTFVLENHLDHTKETKNTNITAFRYNKDLESFLSKSSINYNISGLYSYFDYCYIITKQRIFSIFITPKELVYEIKGFVKNFKRASHLSDVIVRITTLVAEYRKSFLLETKDTLLVFDKSIHKKEEQQKTIDTLDTKNFFALVFRNISKLFMKVNIPNKPILDNIDSYISKENWLDLSLLEYETDQNNITKIFAIHLVRPTNLVINNRQFDILFLQFILRYSRIQGYNKTKHCFVANSSNISKVPVSILALLMDPNDIKDINKFIIKNIQVENVSFYHTMYFITEPLDIEIVGIFENLESNIKINKNHTEYYIFTISCVFNVKQTTANEEQYIIDILDFDNKTYFTMTIKNNNKYKNEDIENIVHKIKIMSDNSSGVNFILNFELSFAFNKKQANFLEEKIKENKNVKAKRISGLFHISYVDLESVKAGFYLSGVLDKHLVELA